MKLGCRPKRPGRGDDCHNTSNCNKDGNIKNDDDDDDVDNCYSKYK